MGVQQDKMGLKLTEETSCEEEKIGREIWHALKLELVWQDQVGVT
jgi:hypothetical protein